MNLGYVIVYVSDVEKTVQFYEDCLGVKRRFVHESGQYAEMETGSTALAFVSDELASSNFDAPYTRNKAAAEAGGFEVVFVVDDVADAYAKAIENGATRLAEPTRKPWGQWVAYVRDCNGVIVELASSLS
ncbi:MAG: VOC family protein [Pseudonocardiaceae bacterium]